MATLPSRSKCVIDEGVPDDAPLLLRVLDAGEAREEEVGRVDDGEVDAEVAVERLVDLLGFVEAEDAVVDHDGVEPNPRACGELPVVTG